MPAKTPSVSTVGGARGQVVVEDKPAPVVQEEDVDTTTIAFAQAEPGHDVFNVVEKPKSDMNAPPPVQEEEKQKSISRVHAAQGTAEVESSADGVSDDSKVSPDSAAETSTASQEAELKTQGPAEEDDAEAERARQELFPEES